MQERSEYRYQSPAAALLWRKSEHQRGRDAARHGVALEELCTEPSLAYLNGYFYEQCGDLDTSIIMAAVIYNVEIGKMHEAVAAVSEIPRSIRNALTRTLITREVRDDDEDWRRSGLGDC
jgi:hypothetical protein